MTTGLIVIWALVVLEAAWLLAKSATKKYGVPISKVRQERKDERELKRLWRKEMG